MQRIKLCLAVTLLLITVLSNLTVVVAKDTWISVQSRNFFLVGNASEKEIRQVGVRLEQFRDVFTRLFPKVQFSTPVPTTVVVFKSHNSFKPFKSNPNIAGYFQPGPDVNYISLTTELEGTQNPFTVIFHEYTHLLVDNTLNNAPLWFNEGLAEYYSTFTISDDQKFVLGDPIANHVFLLRESKMLPLRTLFAVDHKSPHYNERDKQSIFYAQSWALMHYLIIGKAGRADQLATFVNQITANKPLDEAFQQAFQMSIETMEKELREYVRQSRYNILRGHFERKLDTDKSLQTVPVTEADAQAYLGDLLLHSNRKDCETYLEKALALDPNSAMANAAMGMAKVRDGKADQALKYLERAVSANSQNYLVHYYYAYALSRLNDGGPRPVSEAIAPETGEKIRKELLKAIELRPDYPASYELLSFIALSTGTHLEEAQTLILRALKLSPGRTQLVFMLGQLYLRSGDYKQARELIERVVKSNAEDELSAHAELLLKQITAIEEFQQRSKQNSSTSKVLGANTVSSTDSSLGSQPTTTKNVPAPDPSEYLAEVLRKPADGETQSQGTLIGVECAAKGLVFIVKVDGRTLRLWTKSFEEMEITTYSPDVEGEITCGARKGESVVVCFVAQIDKRLKTDGVIKSIEFVPAKFKLKSQQN